MTNIQAIKSSIQRARKDKGLTQKEMAEKIGISQPAYSYYEKGDKPLPVNQLNKVLDILELQLEDLETAEIDPLIGIQHALNRIADVLEGIYDKM